MPAGRRPPPRQGRPVPRIAGRIDLCLSEGLPAVSVDAKKKELLGGFAASGREWGAKGTHVCAGDHDLVDRVLGKAVPYGVYDVGRNEGFVTVGNSADTSDFAVSSMQAWWDAVGRHGYPGADRVLVTCDGGGSNGHRCRLWKYDLQLFADRNGLQVEVCHYPAGTSKSDKIERGLFSHISMGWRGQPLTSLEVVRNPVASTTTRAGLVVRAVTDRAVYRRGRRVTDEEMASLELVRHDFRGEWNYMLRVRRTLGVVA